MLAEGFYDAGELGVLRIKRARGPLRGTSIIIRQEELGWQAIAFLDSGNSVRFFVKFAAENSKQELDAIRKAVAEIAQRHQLEALCYLK